MALDENDLKQIKGLFGELLTPINNRLDELGKIKAEPKSEPKAEPKLDTKAELTESNKQDKQREEMANMQRELRRMAVEKHLPPTVIKERVPILVKLLEADGRLLTRDGSHMLRMERNGQLVDVPLPEALKEWAGTREADPFVRAATAGTGATPSQSAGSTSAASVSLNDVLSAALGKLN